MSAAALPWLALGLLGAAIVAAFGTITARSLFAMCMHMIAAGASAGTTILLLGARDEGLAIALFTAGWAPVLLLATMLLSARAAKGRRRNWPWLSLLSAVAALCAVWWPLVELGAGGAVRPHEPPVGLGFWLAPLLLVAAAMCVGLLGYGERGALARRDDGA